MNKSLNELISNLSKEQLREATKCLKDGILVQESVFPFDYVDYFERYDETEVPSKDKFTSEMTGDEITDKEYERVLTAYKKYSKTLGEYSDLYLKQDVLLLADVFDNFRDVCLETCKLDLCWYFTTPGLGWDAILKMTKIKLQTITDMDMFLVIEKKIRGGMTDVTHRYCESE